MGVMSDKKDTIDLTADRSDKMFSDEFLKEIGFKLVKYEKSKFFPYQYYGMAVDRICLTHIYWNEDGHSVTYFGEKLEENTSVSVRKDADTRTVFNGYVFNQDDMRKVLNLTW